MQYRVYGQTLSCDTPLPELEPAVAPEQEAEADVQVRLSGCRPTGTTPLTVFMSWALPTGEPWLSCSKIAGDYLLQYHGLAQFSVDGTGRHIVGVAEAEIPRDTLRHLLLDQVLPMALSLQGREALHASAVLTPLGVCVFIGPSGTGKSTLAASLLNTGFSLLSDDCLVLEENRGSIVAVAAYPGLRLWDDTVEALYGGTGPLQSVAHYTSKQRLVAGVSSDNIPIDRHPVRAVYCLAPQDGDAEEHSADSLVARLSLREGLMELLSSAFRLDITNRAMLVRQFDFFERVAPLIPVKRLKIHHRFTFLPVIREAILADLADQ